MLTVIMAWSLIVCVGFNFMSGGDPDDHSTSQPHQWKSVPIPLGIGYRVHTDPLAPGTIFSNDSRIRSVQWFTSESEQAEFKRERARRIAKLSPMWRHKCKSVSTKFHSYPRPSYKPSATCPRYTDNASLTKRPYFPQDDFSNETVYNFDPTSVIRIPNCSFPEPRYYHETGAFADEVYAFVRFLHDVLYAQYGWVSIPVAGTALGVLRHGGVTPGDDDIDVWIYPPASLLDATRLFDNSSSWMLVVDTFDAIVEEYSWAQKGKFRWFHNLKGRELLAERYGKLHFRDYHRAVRQRERICVSELTSSLTSVDAKRKRFFGYCMPAQVFICFMPTPFLYERDEPSFLTLGDKLGTGGLCRCPFGPTSLICPRQLPLWVNRLYGKKWCVPVGGVTVRNLAVFKSWND